MIEFKAPEAPAVKPYNPPPRVQPAFTFATPTLAPANVTKLVLPDNSEIIIDRNEKAIGRYDVDRIVPTEELNYISRQHIMIKADGSRYYIEDPGSSNGTKVNGVNITGKGKWELKDGDRITLADVVTLQFRLGSTSIVIVNKPQAKPLVEETIIPQKPSVVEIKHLKKQLVQENKQPKQPSVVWDYAQKGLIWGIYIGVGLKCLDTFIGLVQVNALIAILFLVAIGVCFIPKIGIGVTIAIAFAFSRFTGINMFGMVMGAGIVGAILGALPGMAVGGLAGLIKSKSMADANDIRPAGIGTVITAFVLPLLGAIGLFIVYFVVVNPWFVSLLEQS
ncbi:MAG: FHA domain-containing protein [Dehalococcoidales bacterium]